MMVQAGVDANRLSSWRVVCCPGRVDELRAERLILRPVDTVEAERIVAGRPGPQDCWAEDFPFEGDVVGATMYLRATAAGGDQRPFGHYVVIRTEDAKAIGGIGFKGKPEAGSVEIGYGLVPSARGAGYAAEAVRVLLDFAPQQGLLRVVADTDRDNVASQRTLERAGLTRTGTRGEQYLYEVLFQRGRPETDASTTVP